MRCKSCGSAEVGKFGGEIAIHFPGPREIDKPAVFIFPELAVCMACGTAQFSVPEDQLRLLVEGDAASAGPV